MVCSLFSANIRISKAVSCQHVSKWVGVESIWNELFNISYQGTDPLSCNWGIRDLQMCRISHRLCTHERTRMHFVCSSKSAWCALSTDCPATAAASTAATQNQPPAATNPGEASLCLHGHPYDVRACLCMCPLCVGFVWACEYVCARVGITHNSNFVIVIVAAFLCSAISIWGLNQRWLIMVTPPPLTYTHTQPV